MNEKIISKYEKGTVVISIDDGNEDDFRLYNEILLKYKLSATFNIVTNNIDGVNSVADGDKCLTKEQLSIIYNDSLMEIAAHGHSHKNCDEDILKGIEYLN